MNVSPPSAKLPEVVMPACPVHKLLAGQKALVTGATRASARPSAIALGQAGADVMVNYVRRRRPGPAGRREISHAGSRAVAYQADVSHEDQVLAMFARCAKSSARSTSW